MSNADRIRHARDQRDLEHIVDEFVTQGYEVENRGQRSAVVEEQKGWGSLGVHVILFLTTWWVLWVPNLVYAVVKHSGAETVHIKVRSQDQREARA